MFINETIKPFVVELEPTFIKALKLLHSKDGSSAAELRQIYEETIKKNKKEVKKADSDEAELKSKATLQSSNSYLPDVPYSEKADTKISKDTETKKRRKAVSSDEDTDVSDDDALPTPSLDTDNLLCVVCKSLSQFSQNQLVECQECHGLYHQECHKPAITENINDPRLVWYCSKCSKSLSKKIATKPVPKKPKVSITQASSSSSSSLRNSPLLFSKTLSSSKLEQLSAQQPFRRIESSKPKDPSSSSSSSTSRGLACLAANLASSNKTKTKNILGSLSSSSSNSSSSSSSSKTSKPSMASFSSAISGKLSFASSLNKKN